MSTRDNIRLEEMAPASGPLDASDSPPEGTTVFTTPNASEVKSKLFGTYWAVFIAGLNGMACSKLESSWGGALLYS